MESCIGCNEMFPVFQLSVKEKQCATCLKNRPSSNYKRCRYCMSDFKQTITGEICLKCQELEKKMGSPHQCTICSLPAAFGSGVLCQRCSHYQSKFGDAIGCQNCHRKTAFYKDEESRKKVGNSILCFLCTYDYKLRKARERQQNRFTRKRTYESSMGAGSGEELSGSNVNSGVLPPPTSNTFMGSVSAPSPLQKNDQSNPASSLMSSRLSKPSILPSTGILSSGLPSFVSLTSGDSLSGDGFPSTISSHYSDPKTMIQQSMDEARELNRKLAQKERDLLAKMRESNLLRGEMEDMKSDHREKVTKLTQQLETERDNYRSQLEKMRRENANLKKLIGKKKQRPGTITPFELISSEPGLEPEPEPEQEQEQELETEPDPEPGSPL